MSEPMAFVPTITKCWYYKKEYIPMGFYKVVGALYNRHTERIILGNWDQDYGRRLTNVRSTDVRETTIRRLAGSVIELNTTKFGRSRSRTEELSFMGDLTKFEDWSGRGRRFLYLNTSNAIPLFPNISDPYAISQLATGRKRVTMGFHCDILQDYLDGKITLDLAAPTCRILASELSNYGRNIYGPDKGPLAGVKGRTPDVCEGFEFNRATGFISYKKPLVEQIATGFIRSDFRRVAVYGHSETGYSG